MESSPAEQAAFYFSELKDSDVKLPTVIKEVHPAWHLFVVQSNDRDNLQNMLSVAGIETLIHYPVPTERKSAQSGQTGGDVIPDAIAMCERLLSLPIGPHLTADETLQVTAVLLKGLRHRHQYIKWVDRDCP